MARGRLKVSLRAQIGNEEFRRRTSYQHISTIPETEVAMGGHIPRRTDGTLGSQDSVGVRPRPGKRSVGRPPKRWTEDHGFLNSLQNT
ncbi:jg3504 [Pararge aegeria aegeria]|uniref:Jg3504 protein n=1 Tax=Pararge aegeria aegeria TaxID=348720 RepID=A0A8S4R990_9NEOP|nr:jg3504 [Pararge aegeria aegeria]